MTRGGFGGMRLAIVAAHHSSHSLYAATVAAKANRLTAFLVQPRRHQSPIAVSGTNKQSIVMRGGGRILNWKELTFSRLIGGMMKALTKGLFFLPNNLLLPSWRDIVSDLECRRSNAQSIAYAACE
jgi:hypothetical protein